MRLNIEIPKKQEAILQQESDRLGVTVEELVKAGFNDWMNRSKYDFQRAADYVLEKNKELYEKLN